ncbi:MAG TPA: four helix bundle protein [Casimicrobiaceae bacterium]|nr:four helix bundle protein [Casimicrobiaceae bacterium]
MTIGRYSELAAWQSSMSLVADVYRLTATMPVAEKFGLAQQLRRAAVSIPSNIAEGHARRSRREYLRFVVVAMGSLAELETQLLIANRLAYVTDSTLSSAQRRVDETGKLLRGLERRLIRDSVLGNGP